MSAAGEEQGHYKWETVLLKQNGNFENSQEPKGRSEKLKKPIARA
jgi:hypothetical protein